MANVADAPTFGLASTDDDGRKAALEFAKKALAAVKRWYVYTYLNRGFLYCMCLVACVLCVNICIKYFSFSFCRLGTNQNSIDGCCCCYCYSVGGGGGGERGRVSFFRVHFFFCFFLF